MAKKSIVARNKKRERLEAKVRTKRVSLKAEAKKAYAKGEIPWETLQKLQALPRNSHPTRIKNRCKLCGRGHAVYSKFGICRLCLRKYAMMGYVPGLKKASW